MRKYQSFFGVFITSLILLTGFKNIGVKNISSNKSADKNNYVPIFTEPPKVSIAGTTAIKGDKGQKPVKVMVYLSKPATEVVNVEYSTKDGSAIAGVDYVATNGSVTFQPGEVAKWITVLIIGQVAADPDEVASENSVPNFIVEIGRATGVIIDMVKAYISILPHIPANVAGSQAVYEVIISYTGYTSFHGTAEECGMRRDGVVTLSGYLTGKENVGSDDDIMYTGDLEMIVDMDICSAHRLPNGQDELCGIRVSGTGTVFTELEVYFDGRGGYIKIVNKDGQFRRVVTGSCTDGQVDDEWVMVPNASISSIFNGKELSKLTTRTIRKGVYTETDNDGNITVVQVLRKIQ